MDRLRWRGDRLLALGNTKLVVIDRVSHAILARIAARSAPATVHLGPGDDEVAAVEHDGITVYGYDGVARRTYAFDMERNVDGDTMFTAGSKEVVFTMPELDDTGKLTGSSLAVVDLRTMQRRELAQHITAGPDLSDDGKLVAFIDREGTVHLLDGDLHPRIAFPGVPHAEGLVLGRAGDRVGIVKEHALAVYGLDGKLLRSVAIEPDQSEVLLAGDDVWTGGADGILRHYHERDLIASLPSHTTEIGELRMAGDFVVAAGSDASVVVLRAEARQLAWSPRPCQWQTYSPTNTSVAYACADGRTLVYLGKRLVGTLRASSIGWAAIDPVSDRAAATGDHVLHVFDPKGVEIAKGGTHFGPLDFEDPDHLLVSAEDGIWRWTFATDAWQHVLAAKVVGLPQIAVVAGGLLVAENQALVLYKDLHEVVRTQLADQVAFLSTSRDRRWAAVQLATGGTLIVDGATGAIARTLAPADSTGVASVLDATGDLVIRPSAGFLTVWERATGDNLVFKLEMLRSVAASDPLVAVWGADGRIEIGGHDVGVLDIPRETRPVPELLRAIACRVPLKIVGSRLEPTAPECH